MRILLAAIGLTASTAMALADPMPSWNEGPSKAAIVAFVETVTDPGSSDYVTPADRIAVFDNDGTLWAEQPVY
ncbi:MAG: haloacid dehalogenase-like hydrolase, partial [Pseudomonadota bacterium]